MRKESSIRKTVIFVKEINMLDMNCLSVPYLLNDMKIENKIRKRFYVIFQLLLRQPFSSSQ